MANNIAFLVSSLLLIPSRLKRVVHAYLLALMMDADRHSLIFAEEATGINRSQFSRLLKNHPSLATTCLDDLAKNVAKAEAQNRKPLISRAPWTVAILIDGMHHPRSSLHVHNAQRFNHGKGFVIGHQWTNIVLVINERVIPLPPIEFLSKNVCRKRKVPYFTSHERVHAYLTKLQLAKYIGNYFPEEIVVLMDSGFDDKSLERLILDQGWDFVISMKTSRSCRSAAGEKFQRIDDLFWATRKQAPWKTVRFQTDGGKKRAHYQARKLTGHLKGIHRTVALICSEKSNRKGRRYLTCSRSDLDVGVILRAYRLRWLVELFHRAVKGQFGAVDIGASDFESVKSHIHWSYCAYLIFCQVVGPNADLPALQRKLGREVRSGPLAADIKKIIAARTQFGGQERVKRLAVEAIERHQAA